LQSVVERVVRRLKRDPGYRIATEYSDRQLATMLWYRGLQLMRGLALRVRAREVRGIVFRGRRVVIEHAGQLRAGAGLILEDGVFITALSTDGITLGRNVTIGRGATLTCTGVVARLGKGIRVGDRSAVGAGAWLAGQGGITIGDDVIIGPGTRVFSENHRFTSLEEPIRGQGESRCGVSIGDDCWIGAGATIVDGVTIGRGCVIAAAAVVTSTIPPFSVAAGVPARVIRSRRPDEGIPPAVRTERLPARADLFQPGAHAHLASQ
jgi:acetyltransferase-like isoleucine patch superfamily enzyme